MNGRRDEVALSDPADWCLAQAASAIRTKDLSPLELTEACLRRIEQCEPLLKAFVALDGDRALEEAELLTEEVAHRPPRSVLHGIPIGVKDVIDVAGFSTRAGSRVLEESIAADDAFVTSRLRASGAIILGKTATHEFAFGVMTPPVRNPWNIERSPGGSSGGSAAAVAVGECLGSIGTDTGGSVRIPAAVCGVSGLKPRQGMLPTTGVVPVVHELDTCGPIARSAEDLEEMWRVMANNFSRPPGARETNRRLGTPTSFSSVVDMDGEVEALVWEAATLLWQAGFSRVELEMPSFHDWDLPRVPAVLVEMLVNHKEAGWFPGRANLYSPETLRSLRYAESITAETLVRSLREIRQLKHQLLACFDQVDLLALPTTPVSALPARQVVETIRSEPRSSAVMTMSRITAPMNFCCLAAVSIPCGFTTDGVPVGLQLVGRDEFIVLEAARLYQSVTDFHVMVPRLPD